MEIKRVSIVLASLLFTLVLLHTATEAHAASDTVIGTVRLTATGKVNLRAAPSTSSAILSRGDPGDVYPCTGLAVNGFYPILLSDGQPAFVHSNLLVFTALPTPSPTPAVHALLTVYYQDIYGMLLSEKQLLLSPGNRLISPDSTAVPANYKLVWPTSVLVSVSAGGVATPSSISFLYAASAQPTASPAPLNVQVPVRYLAVDGTRLFTTYVLCSVGTTTVNAQASVVPAGYLPVGSQSAQVRVSADGLATPAELTFYYMKQATPSPAPRVSVPVYYRSDTGVLLYTDYKLCGPGLNTLYADDAKVPSGYTLLGNRSASLSVDTAGRASPASVTFVYRLSAPPISVNVPVYYRDHYGNTFASLTVLASSAAPTKVTADMRLVPVGLVLSSPGTVTVTVRPEGSASPSEVVFSFRETSEADRLTRLNVYEKTRLNAGAHEVYSGPGTGYYRAASGKATVGGGICRVYGAVEDWALIGYGLSAGGYRIGYVRKSVVPSGVPVPELSLGLVPMTVTGEATLTDDPIISVQGGTMSKLRTGAIVHVLAYMGDGDHWAYVEVPDFSNGQPARGFVAKSKLR